MTPFPVYKVIRRHATEDADNADRTLCGRPTTGHQVDNSAPDCRGCIRVINSRCFKHNVPRCPCGTGNIKMPYPEEP